MEVGSSSEMIAQRVGNSSWVAQHLSLVARCHGHHSKLGQRVNIWAIGVAKNSVAEPEEAGESLGGHGQKRSFNWIANS